MKGIYVLFLRVPFALSIPIGGLGEVHFKRGFYAYVGSAMGGIEQRVRRHLKREKKLYWHIDYLLLRAVPYDIIVVETQERKECQLAEELSKKLPYIERFGCSDCKCKSHLFFSSDPSLLMREVHRGMKTIGLRGKEWKIAEG